MLDHRCCYYCVHKNTCEESGCSPNSRKFTTCKLWENKKGQDREAYAKSWSFRTRSFLSKNKIPLVIAVIALIIIMLYPTLIYLVANGPPAGLGTPPEPMG